MQNTILVQIWFDSYLLLTFVTPQFHVSVWQFLQTENHLLYPGVVNKILFNHKYVAPTKHFWVIVQKMCYINSMFTLQISLPMTMSSKFMKIGLDCFKSLSISKSKIDSTRFLISVLKSHDIENVKTFQLISD